jgi:hypothetical protein
LRSRLSLLATGEVSRSSGGCLFGVIQNTELKVDTPTAIEINPHSIARWTFKNPRAMEIRTATFAI